MDLFTCPAALAPMGNSVPGRIAIRVPRVDPRRVKAPTGAACVTHGVGSAGNASGWVRLAGYRPAFAW